MAYDFSRRGFLQTGAAGAAAVLIGCGEDASGSGDGDGGPTPECLETDENVEGPFYKAGAPDRADLAPGLAGRTLTVTGSVRAAGSSCAILSGALLDIWQADDAGVYDDAGYRLRGRVYSGAGGRFQFSTIVPGNYAGRPRHIHVKASAPGFKLITTQLYFPDDQLNDGDAFFLPTLLMRMHGDKGGRLGGVFDFVLAPA